MFPPSGITAKVLASPVSAGRVNAKERIKIPVSNNIFFEVEVFMDIIFFMVD